MDLDIFQHATELTDEELEAEYEAVHSDSFSEVIECPDIRYELKQHLIEHKSEVIQEMNKRESGEWAIPLYQFGLFDF